MTSRVGFKFVRGFPFLKVAIVTASLAVGSPVHAEEALKRGPLAPSDLVVEIKSQGLDEVNAKVLTEMALDQPSVHKRLDGVRHRLLASEFKGQGDSSEYSLKVYDYDHDLLVDLKGRTTPDLKGIQSVRVHEVYQQLNPTDEEFDEAVQLLKQDENFGRSLLDGTLTAYKAMPGVIPQPSPANTNGRSERVISVGLMPQRANALPHEIVGINLSRMKVIRYPDRAPETTIATDVFCGWPNAGQYTTARGTQGQAEISIKKAGVELWKFTAVRPSASSGYWGSAVDLVNVTYKGKLMLSEMHVPILNVNYDGNVCGPYRDWQYSESAFNADGSNLASGIRRTVTRPETILESGTDFGNFRGIAVYTDGPETILVTELEAGWYRYISSYSFHEDGTIRPRFGFSGVEDSCICRVHHHHVFWRFDFEIGGHEAGNTVESFDGSRWNAIARETRQYREAATQKWRVSTSAPGNEIKGYVVEPGENDGTANAFGKGDAWILKYHEGQTDDSQAYIGTSNNLNAFVTGESVLDTDIVFWYGAHFTHDTQNPDTVAHVVGPTLRPY
ncbi:MAG: hypothetical protein H7222_09490 [Methylotenera sp.]|nr:hypothetical protein [Oligoflexia bacterium]